MTTDVCGNIYAVVMSGAVWRITPSGEKEVVIRLDEDAPEGQAITAINFGSGAGGWKADHLYVSSFYHGIYELDMGITGKPEPHLQ
jgi:sugar lactone lactonase YvrE